ncbi:OLC1v1017675C1 [Oldenlandia corymbosa var. corymbosa]|uniref:OLC1v1017675C1 n=1 Tax=Oldenlandia corymbosa var. corymbosa TaxID=529605 RepID=A0AAV1EA01_OLDCO|nr:OLC1v1017675C1 [Oldenlandia corymbosa var. corymbosa]
MEMRAVEDIDMAEDLIIPPLPPLAFCLHDSYLSTHCSACCRPLPDSPFPPTLPPDSGDAHTLVYCSPRCCSDDSPLHSSSSEHNLLCQTPSPPTSPLGSSSICLSLRLLNHFIGNRTEAVNLTRIGGLVTNYERFAAIERNDDSGDNVLGMIKEGASRMLLAGNFGDDMAAVAEAMVCLVLTNAVEVQDNKGRNVGIGVYDTAFSWINHSCSPNACYRFTEMTAEVDRNAQLRIYPAAMIDDGGGEGDDAAGPASDMTRREGYGPRIIVRSIQDIKKDEEVTISYTDLLQPKVVRHRELLAKYQFSCCCKRCRATPATYVDQALQAIVVCSPDGQNLISDDDIYESNASQELMDVFDNAVDEYLTFNNPEMCCTKLEELLRHGHPNVRLEPRSGISQSCIRLYQFHHLCLNAYTTLASAYRVRASDFMAFPSENHNHLVEAFSMSKISAAYSLLLAAVTQHLFLHESSLIVTVANYWICAGESLAFLCRSSMWATFLKLQASISENMLLTSHNCYQAIIADVFAGKELTSELFAEKSGQFLNCIVNLVEKLWNFLTEEGSHLKEIRNHINFRGLLVAESPYKSITHLICNCYRNVPRFEANAHISQDSMDLFHLGVHCLIYGAYLSFVCFSKQPHLASDVVKFLYHEDILSGIQLKF